MDGNFKITGYDESRLDDFINLFYNTVHTVNSADYTEEQLNAWAPQNSDRERWRKNLENSFVAAAFTNDGVLAGYATLCGENEFDLLFINHNYLRRGIAFELAERVECEAARRGAKTVFTEASITARPFFEKRGYKIVKEQKKPFRGEVFTNYVMQKALSNGEENIQYTNYYNIFPISINDLIKTSVGEEFKNIFKRFGFTASASEFYQMINASGEFLGAFGIRALSENGCDIVICIDRIWRGKGMSAEFLKHAVDFVITKKGYCGVSADVKGDEKLEYILRTAGFENDKSESGKMLFIKKTES